MTSYDYTLDAADIIRFVSDEWLAFGVQNEGSESRTSDVVGHTLWEFIADPETRHLYRALFVAVRETGHNASVPFRCDAPDRRRYMRLTISVTESGGLELRSELLREEMRPPVALMGHEGQRSSDILRMCGWCKRVWHGGAWVEVEEAIQVLDLFAGTSLPRISHGICESCQIDLEATIEDVRST